MGILIEHHGGAFPVWLAPVQVRVLPVADTHRGEARALASALGERSVRADVDERDDTLGKRIRDAELAKIPFVVVWGDRETRDALAVRRRGGDGVATASLDALVAEIVAEHPSS
jgi:threonyl-tRNA synthetase